MTQTRLFKLFMNLKQTSDSIKVFPRRLELLSMRQLKIVGTCICEYSNEIKVSEAKTEITTSQQLRNYNEHV